MPSPRGIRSLATTALAGRDLPSFVDPRCRICKCAERKWIEMELVRGASVKAISAHIDQRSSLRSTYSTTRGIREAIDRHRERGHLDIDDEMRRAIVEDEIRQMGMDPDEMAGSLVTEMSLMREVVRVTYTDIVDGKLKPKVADGLAAAKMLHDVKSPTEGVNREVLIAGIMAVGRIVLRHADAEAARKIKAEMKADPDLWAVFGSGFTPEPAMIQTQALEVGPG